MVADGLDGAGSDRSGRGDGGRDGRPESWYRRPGLLRTAVTVAGPGGSATVIAPMLAPWAGHPPRTEEPAHHARRTVLSGGGGMTTSRPDHRSIPGQARLSSLLAPAGLSQVAARALVADFARNPGPKHGLLVGATPRSAVLSETIDALYPDDRLTVVAGSAFEAIRAEIREAGAWV